MLYGKYRLKNAVDKRKPRNFIHKIIRSTKNACFIKTQIHFDIIYNVVDLELRRDFRRPDNA